MSALFVLLHLCLVAIYLCLVAIYLCLVAIYLCLLALINIGSSTAFNALISLPALALYISYFFPIFFLFWRRLSSSHPASVPWVRSNWKKRDHLSMRGQCARSSSY